MKLSFRSKLMARATPGLRVRRDRPMAESASALIMPPWTKPAWLAMSGVGVISRTANPSPSSASSISSHAHAALLPLFTSPLAGEVGGAAAGWGCARVLSSLTALPLRHRHAGGGGPRDEAVLVVQHVRLAEQQRLAHVYD